MYIIRCAVNIAVVVLGALACPHQHALAYVLDSFFASTRHVLLLHEQSKPISLCKWLPAMCVEEAGQTDRQHEHKQTSNHCT